MKKLLLILLIVCLLPALFGCIITKGVQKDLQTIRTDMVTLAEMDKANVEALKQASNILRETWPFYSGCLDAISDRLSGKAIEQKNQLDELYALDEWDDRAAGKTLTLRGLLIIELTTRGVEEVLPGFLKLLAPLF